MATMTFTEAVQEIRREWRQIMPQITEPAKQRVNGETSWICPICGHGTHGDGLTANPQSKDGNGLKCFACDFSGDITDLHMRVTGKDFAEAINDLAGMIGLAIEDGNTSGLNGPQRQFNQKSAAGSAETHPAGKTQQEATETAKQAQDFTAYYAACRAAMETQAGQPGIDYLNSRGVLITAIHYGAGYDSKTRRIVIPCSNSFYIARSIDPQEKIRYLNPKGAPAALFNEQALYAQEVQEVFITEGIYDALSIIEAGGQAIALNSTSNARALIKKLEQHPTRATLIICLDNDQQGSKTAQEVQEALQRLQIPFITADICTGCKDPNEALLQDYTAFYGAVQNTIADARAYKEKQRQEQERRTGPGMVDAFLETVKTRRFEPVPTGITDIDYALYGGFTRQTLILLGAAPGAGKTALAQTIFESMAKQGHTVLYLNLEMSREQMLARSLARMAAQNGERITPAEIKQGYKWDFAQEAIVQAAAAKYKAEIAQNFIYNPDGVTANLDSILEYIEREAVQAEAAGKPAPLICIDYLQLIGGKEREDDTSIIKRAVSSFKNFAIKHNTIVFAIMAQNRPANKSGTVTMESGRDTSALEYSADLQLGLAFTRCLYREGYETKPNREALTPEEMRYITLVITKCRDGRAGKEVDLYFNGETMTYTQISKEEAPEEPARPGWNWDNAIKR